MLDYNKLNITSLGDISHIIKIADKSISLDKKSNMNPYTNGLWIKHNNQVYYFKAMKDITCLINDLLGVKVTQFFDLPSVEYKLAKGTYNGHELFGVISKYERKRKYNYENLSNIVYGENSIIESPYDITGLSFLEALEDAYGNQPITNQLKTLFVRDLITNETDRKMSEIHLRSINGITEIDKIFDYEKEWQLTEDNQSSLDEIDIKESNINLSYKIPGLLSLTENDLPFIRNDSVIQEALHKSLNLNIITLLEEVKAETKLPLSSVDYDYYSLYSETVKNKLIKGKYLA